MRASMWRWAGLIRVSCRRPWWGLRIWLILCAQEAGSRGRIRSLLRPSSMLRGGSRICCLAKRRLRILLAESARGCWCLARSCYGVQIPRVYTIISLGYEIVFRLHTIRSPTRERAVEYSRSIKSLAMPITEIDWDCNEGTRQITRNDNS